MVLLVVVLLLLIATPVMAQTPCTGFSPAVSGTSWTQSGGVCAPAATYGRMRWAAPFGPNQQVAAIVSFVPDENETVLVMFREVDANNRYSCFATRSVGTAHDTVTINRNETGLPTGAVAGPISLGTKIKVNDRLGVRVTSNLIECNYYSVDVGWQEWRTVATFTATTTPGSSYIGVGGAAPLTITQFLGQGDAPAGDTAAPQPDPVTNVAASTLTDTTISLTSDECTDVAFLGYINYRCDATAVPGCTPTSIGTDSARTFTVTGLTANTAYRFQRKCIDGNGNTSINASNVATATTLAGPDTTDPSAPGALTIAFGPRITDPGTFPVVSLNIAAPATDDRGVTVYGIEMGTASNCSDCTSICQVPLSAFPGTISIGEVATCQESLAYGMTRYFRVNAFDAAGNDGPYTATVGITTPASYHTAAPARPLVVAKPVVVAKPANIEDEPVP